VLAQPLLLREDSLFLWAFLWVPRTLASPGRISRGLGLAENEKGPSQSAGNGSLLAPIHQTSRRRVLRSSDSRSGYNSPRPLRTNASNLRELISKTRKPPRISISVSFTRSYSSMSQTKVSSPKTTEATAEEAVCPRFDERLLNERGTIVVLWPARRCGAGRLDGRAPDG
jgi:hypothetical protein